MDESSRKRPRMGNSESNAGSLSCTSKLVTTETDIRGAEESRQNVAGNGIVQQVNIVLDSEDFDDILYFSDAFVDKTLFVRQFFVERQNLPKNKEQLARKVLITAPNCFGKSVIMSMLKKFLEIVVNKEGKQDICVKKNEAGKWIEDEGKTLTENFELFKNNNLNIYRCQCEPKHTDEDCQNGKCESRQFFYEHCGQHPIISLSFKDVRCDSWEISLSSLRGVLHRAYQQHGYLGDKATSHLSESDRQSFDRYFDDIKNESLTEAQVQRGIELLAKYLHKQFGRKVIILTDGFDAPLMRLIHRPQKTELSHINNVIDRIGNMLSSVLKGNSHVGGALINACGQLARIISPYANNLVICPFLENHPFSEYYGFTQHEVHRLLQKPRFKGFDEEKILHFYSGYQVLERGTKICSPFSLLKYLDWNMERKQNKENEPSPEKRKHKPRRYWTENHGVQLQKLFENEKIRKKIRDIQTGESNGINSIDEMYPEDVLDLQKLIGQSDFTDLTDENVHLLIQYLKDRGYFNVIKKVGEICELEIPDGEIRDEIEQRFLQRHC